MSTQEEGVVPDYDSAVPGASEREQGVEGQAELGDHDALLED